MKILVSLYKTSKNYLFINYISKEYRPRVEKNVLIHRIQRRK